MATLGWMSGCWLVSALNADASTLSGYGGSVAWLALAAFTFVLPQVAPPKSPGKLTVRQRLGLDALALLRKPDNRVVFLTVALFAVPLAAFYPYTPTHLRETGLERTSAWMSAGQVSEIIAMFSLSALLARWRLKWIIGLGLVFGVVRFGLCALDGRGWLLAGISLHGCSFTLVLITAQIYVDERVDPAWRARAQALMSLMISGAGNLTGYLGVGWWFAWCTRPDGTHWPMFWGVLAAAVAAVMGFFLVAYRGVGTGLTRPRQTGSPV
jgi:MFS family permease